MKPQQRRSIRKNHLECETIRAESRKGHGAEFILKFPVGRASTPEEVSA
jgi:hypothetical protein